MSQNFLFIVNFITDFPPLWNLWYITKKNFP